MSSYEAPNEIEETPAPDDEDAVLNTSHTEQTNTPEMQDTTDPFSSFPTGSTSEPVDLQPQPSESISPTTSSYTSVPITQDSASEEFTSASPAHSQDPELVSISVYTTSNLQDGFAHVNVLNANAEPTTTSENTSRTSDGNTNAQDLLPESNVVPQIVSNAPIPIVYAESTSVPRIQLATSTVALISIPQDESVLTSTTDPVDGEEMGTAMHNLQVPSTTLDLHDDMNPNSEPSITSENSTFDLQRETSDVASLSTDDTEIDTADADSEDPSHEADIYDDPPIMPLPEFIIPYGPSHPRRKLFIDILALAVRNYEFKTSQAIRTTEIEFLLHMIDLFENKCTALRIENRQFRRQNERLRREVAPPDYNQALREGAFDEWSAGIVSGAAVFASPQRSDYSRNEPERTLTAGLPPDYIQTDARPRTAR
ncbi:hypothetical protein C0995_010642 [Termitomyces sp. Mi166|nr:hypothetical protein C0995_010642 [Termitomyces sp. Mi166\